MEERHRIILRHHRANIRMDLDPEKILPNLVEILDDTDEGEIKAQSTREKSCDTLLEILPRKGPNAFKVFVEALKKKVSHLASDLIEAEKGTENELSYTREQSAKRRRKILELKTELEVEKQIHMKTSQELIELKRHPELISKTETSGQIQTLADVIQQLRDEFSSRYEDLKDERDFARRENQTLKKEIKELKKKSKDYQGESQPLQKNLQFFSWKLEPANEEQQQKMGQSQGKYKELEDKVTNRTPEVKELPAEIMQHRGESCSCCATLRNEGDPTITEIQKLGREIQELKKGITKIIKDYQPNTQTPQKWHQGPEEKHPSPENKALNKKHQEEIKDLQKKIKKLLEDLEKSKEVALKLEKELQKSQSNLGKIKKDLARENEKVKDYQQKFEEESKAKDDLLKQNLKNETHMSEENNNLREELKEERSKLDNLKKEVHRLRLTPKDMPGRIYSYSEDFDKRGVVYDLATNFGKTSQVNLSSTQIVVTRSSDGEGHAKDLLKNQVKRGTLSGTKDKEDSWWRVDLTEKYALYLTHYTLRHGRDRSIAVLLNWRLEGSLDGRKWTTLKNHVDDHGLKEHRPYCTCTWAIDGNSNAYRFFRIFQTAKNSSGRFGICLSGIELYGVRIEKSN